MNPPYGRVLYLHGVATLMTVSCSTADEYQKEIDAAFKWAESEHGETGVWGQVLNNRLNLAGPGSGERNAADGAGGVR